MRVVPPANIHLTLAFLGDQPVGASDAIVGAMSAAARAGQIDRLSIADPLLLPPRRPRVLAVSIGERGSALADLRAELADELELAIGWSEARAFRPHLTVARMGRDARAPRELSPPPSGEFSPGELVLYRSHLEPSGARYEAVERVALV